MRPFDYVEPSSLEEVVQSLQVAPKGSRVLSGGTDLLSEMKEGLVEPPQLVSLSGVAELDALEVTPEGLRIGAMATLADIAEHPEVRARYRVLAQAAEGVATPQIRNVGTLGGNLCQRPRCFYYRSALTRCLKKGGDICFALAGNSKYLAILGGEGCYIVHPSDLAPALISLGGEVEVAGPSGRRTMPLESFFIGPGQDMLQENVLGPGELLTSVQLLSPADALRSLYLKARERATGDFALASVAACVRVDDGHVAHASIVLGGVAPFPYRAHAAEEYLSGRPVGGVELAEAGQLAVAGATPLKDNAYKITLTANLVERALTQLLLDEPPF